jgi:hypothetical protein
MWLKCFNNYKNENFLAFVWFSSTSSINSPTKTSNRIKVTMTRFDGNRNKNILLMAAKKGDTSTVEAIIKENTNIEVKDE